MLQNTFNPPPPIFVHQGFCVYEALAHRDMIRPYVYFNSSSSSIQWVVSLLFWLTKLSVLNVSLRNNKQQNQRQA